jgi:hypothetical protein
MAGLTYGGVAFLADMACPGVGTAMMIAKYSFEIIKADANKSESAQEATRLIKWLDEQQMLV